MPASSSWPRMARCCLFAAVHPHAQQRFVKALADHEQLPQFVAGHLRDLRRSDGQIHFFSRRHPPADAAQLRGHFRRIVVRAQHFAHEHLAVVGQPFLPAIAQRLRQLLVRMVQMQNQGLTRFEMTQLVIHERAQMLFAKMARDGHVARRTVGANEPHNDAACMADV